MGVQKMQSCSTSRADSVVVGATVEVNLRRPKPRYRACGLRHATSLLAHHRLPKEFQRRDTSIEATGK